jgi:hypothetical protein
MGGIGFMLVGLHIFIMRKKYVLGSVLVAAAGYLVGVIKAYIMFPLFLAAGAWFAVHRIQQTGRNIKVLTSPVYLVIGAGLSLGLVMVVSQLFPRFALENLANEISTLQALYARQHAGSTIVIGDPTQTSLGGQLAFAPLALVSALLRPLIFEVHNATSLINGLEMMVILWLWWEVLRRRRSGAITAIAQNPFLVFCTIFVLVFALPVGLAAPNLGSLSRYRIPMMPFYICVLLSLLPWRPWERKPAPRAD